MELSDSLRGAKDPLGPVSRHLGRLAVVAAAEEIIELCDEQLVRAAQVVPHGHAQGQVAVVESVLNTGGVKRRKHSQLKSM